MTDMNAFYKKWRTRASALLFLGLALACSGTYAASPQAMVSTTTETRIENVVQINPTTVEIVFNNRQRMTLDFYGDNIFRMFQDNNGGILRDPQAEPEARILADQPRKECRLTVTDEAGTVTIGTGRIEVKFDKGTALMTVTDLTTGTVAREETAPVDFQREKRW